MDRLGTFAEPPFSSDALVRPLKEIVPYVGTAPQLLAVVPLFGPGLVPDVSTIADAEAFNTGNWSPTRLSAFPDAHTLREDATVANSHFVTNTPATASIGPVTVSVDIEPDGRTWCIVQSSNATNVAYFNLAGAGAVGTQTGCVGTIQELTAESHPGRYRCTVTSSGQTAAPIVRIYTATANGVFLINGDITKGLKLYNAQITQTSIVTAPNLLGAEMLAAYGDRYDFTNPTKASQLVRSLTGWNGLGCAVASGANWAAADAMAARFTGTDKPLTVIAAVQESAASGGDRTVFGLGRSTVNTPLQYLCHRANYRTEKRDDAALDVLNDTAVPVSLARKVLGWTHTGTTETLMLNGSTTWLNNVASDVNAMTVNQATIAMERVTVATGGFGGNVRAIAIACGSLSATQLAAASRIVMAYAGGI